MLIASDPVNAFVDYPAIPVPNAPSGPLAGLTFGVKDIFDVVGYPTGSGNPAKRAAGIAAGNAPVVQKLLDAGARFVGKTHTAELAFSLDGRHDHYGTPTNPASPGRVPGGRRRALRFRARQRYRRLGARAGLLLRPRRAAADPWPRRYRRRHAAGAGFRHGRLVHPRRRDL